MGRITIFAVENCRHCLRLKAALESHDIPYVEISLSSHPERRSDMISLSDRVTVPQAFFNDNFVGGADDTIELLNRWDADYKAAKTSAYTSLRDRYEKEISSLPDPVDPRLVLPVKEALPSEQKQQDIRHETVELPNGCKALVLEVTKMLLQTLPLNSLKSARTMTIYKRCFRGNEGVTSLIQQYPLCSREQLVQFGRYLQTINIINSIPDHATLFTDSPNLFFRLQPFQSPDVLNSFRNWDENEPVNLDPLALVGRLAKLLENVLSPNTVSVGEKAGMIDYVAASQVDAYFAFEEATCEIQAIDLGVMDRSTKMAFCINLYNLIVRHAYLKVGIPSSSLTRNAFFSRVKYNVGRNLYSLNDLEHGILRGNARPPYSLFAPFSSAKSDPRWNLIIEETNPRIHFALNCGARSCPPVKTYSVLAIEDELQVAAEAFCEDDGSGVRIYKAKREIHLSLIFKWYCVDFGCHSTSQLPSRVLPFLRGAKREALQSILEEANQNKKLFVVKFLPYDWSSNASESKVFDSSMLDSDEVTFRAILSSS